MEISQLIFQSSRPPLANTSLEPSFAPNNLEKDEFRMNKVMKWMNMPIQATEKILNIDELVDFWPHKQRENDESQESGTARPKAFAIEPLWWPLHCAPSSLLNTTGKYGLGTSMISQLASFEGVNARSKGLKTC